MYMCYVWFILNYSLRENSYYMFYVNSFLECIQPSRRVLSDSVYCLFHHISIIHKR